MKHYIIYIIYIHSTSEMSVVTKDPTLKPYKPNNTPPLPLFPYHLTILALDTPNSSPPVLKLY